IMSIEYYVFTESKTDFSMDSVALFLDTTPLPIDFAGGPYAIRLLEDRCWDYSHVKHSKSKVIRNACSIACCRKPDAAAMDELLDAPNPESIREFFAEPGRGLIPVDIEADFSFARQYDGESASEYLDTSVDDECVQALISATRCVRVLATGEGWVHLVFAHALAHVYCGLFFDPQSGDRTLYRMDDHQSADGYE
ncbi:MAG: hypothetical protein WBD31_24925, partial [Rubripirellula sp.]